MWDLLFTITLFVSFQIAAVLWTERKMPSLLSIGLSATACLSFGIASLFIENRIWLMTASAAGHVMYVVIETVGHRVTDALTTVSLCLVSDTLLIPFISCDKVIKSYSFYGLVILLSMIYAGLYRTNERPEPWLKSVRERSSKAYVVLACVPLFGVATQIFALLTHNKDNSVFTTIGTYVLLICIAAATVLIQRLCAEHYLLSKIYYEMQAWQQGARDYMNTIRSQRHDFNIHMHAIDGMIENGDYEQCRLYVDKMVEEANDVNDIMPVYDAMIGSMLYNMRREAQLLGSDIYYDIKYDMKHVVCNAFECNKIIGNLLRNAIDALDNEQAIQQGIQVNIFRRSGNAVVTVSNYFHGDEQTVLRAFDMNWSSKAGHEGIGLGMIERMLKKYSGRIMVEWQDKSVTFIVHIPVKYLPEEDTK